MANEPLFDDLYREVILDHSRNPRNVGTMTAPDRTAEGLNPVCGDAVRLDLALDSDQICGLMFDGQGCAISQASASLLTERLHGATLGEARGVCQAMRAMLVEGADPDAVLGDLEALHGVAKFPVRVKCAMLAWKLLEGVLEQPTPSGAKA
ncbi:MAG: Fe-S cluster assembly sulfur transfer protein SufU [Dehalococcoidia bacterium]